MYEKKKKITKSTTDSDCGMFHKGEHERQFAYVTNTVIVFIIHIFIFSCSQNKIRYIIILITSCMICPNNEVLKYSTTNRDGYREYTSNPKICQTCQYKNKCTESKANQKIVMRHIWEDYLELTEDYRQTPKYKEIYERRKETIDRVFAEAKERHGMR